MLKTLLPFCLCCVVGCATSPPRPTEPITNYFDCDVPPGKFSQWNQSISSNIARLSGTLQMIEARKDPNWSPSAGVLLIGADDSLAVGLKMILLNDDPSNADLALLGPGGNRALDTLATIPWAGRSVPFTLSLTDSGRLSVTAEGISRSISLNGFQLRKVELVCSTGQFKFKDVVVANR